MTTAEKVRENRARRAVARQGYRLVKIRRRDRRAIDYGKFLLRRLGVATDGRPLTLEQVEAWIER
jgi:hypothetical protein